MLSIYMKHRSMGIKLGDTVVGYPPDHQQANLNWLQTSTLCRSSHPDSEERLLKIAFSHCEKVVTEAYIIAS